VEARELGLELRTQKGVRLVSTLGNDAWIPLTLEQHCNIVQSWSLSPGKVHACNTFGSDLAFTELVQ
jgi:hypothetical protein